MSKVVLVGGEFRNKGCEAMIISTIATLKNLLPSANFSVLSRYPEDANKDSDSEFKVVWDARNVRSRSFLLLMAFLYRMIPLNPLRQLLTRKNSVLREFCCSDIVVDVSGFALTDDIGLKRILVFCSGIILCKLLGTPFVGYPQSMGPFNSLWSRMVVRLFLPMADMIMIRGKQTKKHLDKIGIDTKGMHVCADSAFLLEAAPPERAVEILDRHGMVEKTLVGIIPSIRIYDRCDGAGAENTYVILLTNIVDYIVNEFDAQVALIPFEFMSDGHDDRLLVNEILRNMKRHDSVLAIDKEYSAAELKAVIGQLDLLLASRFHSVVASASMGVPVVVIGWSDKYVELMNSFGLEEYVIDYRKTTLEEIKRLLKKMCLNEEEIVKKLKIEVKNIEKSALEAGELVKNSLLIS